MSVEKDLLVKSEGKTNELSKEANELLDDIMLEKIAKMSVERLKESINLLEMRQTKGEDDGFKTISD